MKNQKLKNLEEKFEKIKNEPNIETKIRRLEAMKEFRESQNEEYKKEMNEGIKDRRIDIAKNNKAIRSFEEEIKLYETLDKNKEKIANIKEYKEFLKERLQKLEEKKKKTVDSINSKYSINLKLIERKRDFNDELKGISEEIEEIDNKLKSNKNLKPTEKEELESKKEELSKKNNQNVAKYMEFLKKNKDKNPEILKEEDIITEEDRNELNSIDSQIEDTKSKLNNCDLVYSSLLQGKDWEEIEELLSKQKQVKEIENSEISNEEELENEENADQEELGIGENSNQEEEIENNNEARYPSKISFAQKLLNRIRGLFGKIKGSFRKGKIVETNEEGKDVNENDVDNQIANIIKGLGEKVETMMNSTPSQELESNSRGMAIAIKTNTTEDKDGKMNFNDRLYNYHDKEMKKRGDISVLKDIAEEGYKQIYRKKLNNLLGRDENSDESSYDKENAYLKKETQKEENNMGDTLLNKLEEINKEKDNIEKNVFDKRYKLENEDAELANDTENKQPLLNNLLNRTRGAYDKVKVYLKKDTQKEENNMGDTLLNKLEKINEEKEDNNIRNVFDEKYKLENGDEYVKKALNDHKKKNENIQEQSNEKSR